MTQETTEIEVEVLEIDGVAPVTPVDTPRQQADWQDWRQWGGRIRKLDNRWWPLWVILGSIALVLLLTIGLVIGVVFLVFRLFRSLVQTLLG
jgi:hypothetical protein